MRIMSPFPSEFGFSCVTPEDLDDYLPHPDEMRCLSPRAIPKRRREFFLGRLAAFRAIQTLGITPEPVLRGSRREPLWQEGIVGAISHKEDTAVAVVGRKSMACGVGVDLEDANEPIHFRISKTVCTEAEVDWITESPDEKDTRLKMIFSAKEAAFKAYFPIQHIYLNHHRNFFFDKSIQSFLCFQRIGKGM